MKEFIFDWSIFEGQGFLFQDMCADIFKAHNYRTRTMEKGGSDEGRDIIIYKDVTEKLIEFKDSPYAWVECKSQINGSPMNINKIKTNFIYALKEDVAYLVFMTNHKFNNEAHNLFVEYNKIDKLPFKIRYIEKEELEDILRATPSVYLKYFDKDGVIEDYPQIDSKYPNYKIAPNSHFVDEFENVSVTIKNSFFSTKELDIYLSKDIQVKEQLEPFEEKEIKFPLDRAKLPDNITLSYKIDHLYVDPFRNRDKVLELLKFNNSIYISGSAGTGKSRLLKEVAKGLHIKPIIFDISTDYSKNFLDHLLSQLLGIEIEYLKLLPETFIVSHLKDLIKEDSIPVFISYIKQNENELNYDIILSETAEFFSDKWQNQIIYIDNIHCFSVLDYKLFERINSRNSNNYILFTARENEITEKVLSQYLNRLLEEKRIAKINLTETDIKTLIRCFIEGVSANIQAKSFLSIYQNVENFQQFIFTLKTLRLKGIISQDENGKILISDDNKKLDIHDYKELYQDLNRCFQVIFPNKNVSEILELGAVFGYNFPVELIENFHGDDALDIIDNLVIQEFLKENNKQHNGNIFVNFDHELTREIIYNAISPIKKKKLHKQIIDYIENLGTFSSLYSYRQLAYHYESTDNLPKAAEFSNKEGHKQQQKSQLETAFRFFESSLNFVDVVQKESSDDLYDIEADSLNQIIKLQLDLFGADDVYGKIRSLDVLSLLLNNDYYKGIAAYYFAKYYFEIDEEETSLRKIQNSIDLFCHSEFEVEHGNALNFKGVILKNNRDFELAKEIHEQAIKIFETRSHWSGVSMALADLGAVYLESGEGKKTIDFWKKSLDVAKKTINSAEICNRLIDYTYILALFDGQNPDIKDEMENAIFMAEKLNIKPSICRAKINYANFLFFNDAFNPDKIKSLIEDAIKISQDIKDDYLSLLSQFSYFTFQKKYANHFAEKFCESITNLLLQFCSDNEMSLNGGDNRITNIAKFLITENIEKTCTFVKKSTASEIKDFMNKAKKQKLEIIEKDNPYLKDGLFATYY